MRRFDSARKLIMVVACALTLVGCNGLDRRDWQKPKSLADDSDARLLESNRQLADAKERAAKAQSELADINKKLSDQNELQQVLQQRVDNLKREKDRLSGELKQVVMNAARFKNQEADVVTAVNALEQPAKSALPDKLIQNLMELTRSGEFEFDPSKNMLRASSAKVFTNGSDRLKREIEPTLRRIASALNDPSAKTYDLLIVCHTSSLAQIPRELLAEHPTDWHLAAHQAIAVQQFLEESQLAPARVGIISYGSYQPLVEGSDESTRQRNERVEIYIRPPRE